MRHPETFGVTHEDLRQEACATALRIAAGFRGTTQVEFNSWMARVVRSEFTRLYRRRGQLVPKNAHLLSSSCSNLDDLASNAEPLVEQTSRSATAEEAVRTLAVLPARQARILHLRFWETRTIREIALELKLTERAVYYALDKATSNLRVILKARLGGDAGSRDLE